MSTSDFQKQVQAIIDESREEERTAQVEVEADEGDENFYFKGTVAFFGSDGDDVGDNYRESIIELAEVLKDNEGIQVRILGFADPRGPMNHNKELAQRRSQNVATILKENGVELERIEVVSRGAVLAPKDIKDEPELLQLERRVDIMIGTPEALMAH